MSINVANEPSVGLFATCLVDLMRPSVGFATAKLIKNTGCNVIVPIEQTCCGQPAYNSGDNVGAKAIARKVILAFKNFEYIVVPSGSCASMISNHYPTLFKEDGEWLCRAKDLAKKTFELTNFLADIQNAKDFSAGYDGVVTYHDSCSSLRELQIKDQPRKLLKKIKGLELIEGIESETCCGFGGLFCVKYPEISSHIVDAKISDILSTKADTLLANDLGCLINISGKLKRRGSLIKVRHIAEVLANMTDVPPIGDGFMEKKTSCK
ncbi:MAG: (Fe-S)-binding protein [Pseudomonadota bacterium]|nr:(Fe-S)-binding protein [Pseudomonadota bacterium]